MKKRNILVTSALPYANGPIHLGHLVEYIQTDIWVRFQNLIGNNCYYMCADDTHGTPIMLSAKKQNISPEELINKMNQDHQDDFKSFLIHFDHYYTTNSEENRVLAEFIYAQAKEKGFIEIKNVEQLYCETCNIFLPDRFIKGTCPKCNAPDQYGDSCEVCSATYSPTDLIEPRCSEGHTQLISKSSAHHFFKLSAFTKKLKEWVNGDHIKDETKNKLQEWFSQGLKDWDISRDAPYFGFKIPGTEDKYFYVWMDAPVGYMATTQKWCDSQPHSFDDIWRSDQFEIHHFIGKDILYFHTLFWPAMLMVSGFSTPTKVNVHGFLTVNGEKMSKSRGTFILAKTYMESLNPEFLRYYYASKLSSSVEDLDLSFEDFCYKVNAEIVNKVINIASRLGAIVNKKLSGQLSQLDATGSEILAAIRRAIPAIQQYYEDLEFNKATREIMGLADIANKYINDAAPWEVLKTDEQKARQICTAGLNAFRILIILLSPILPKIAKEAQQFLNCSLNWSDLESTLLNCTISPYTKLAERITIEDTNHMIHAETPA